MSVYASVVLLAAEGEEKLEAHHWWWPENKEIIWGGLAFLIVLFALIKFAGPATKKAMATRSERIGKQLSDAANAKASAEAEAARITANLKDLDATKAKIVADARAAAEQVVIEGKRRNDEEVADLESKGTSDIEVSRGRVATELQAQVASLSAEAAERAVRARLDDATLQQLIEQYIARVGSAGSGNGSAA